MGKPYEEYNAQFNRLKRAQEAEEARFTDFNQGENYFSQKPDPQMNQPSGYQIQQQRRQQEEEENARQREAYGEGPSNRDQGRVIKSGGNDEEFDDNDWGDDADDMLPD